MNNGKRLTKSATERMLCGVCGGIAEYIGTDPTVIRVLWVIFSLMGGSGLLAYIIAAIIIPEE
ncbi:MAG: PspC domain-containing protein [Lachnospiraceae bacterium]|jgi:phage shock protein C|nr:PspC domain-containing protein [Lachnospiraceae bacterium]MBR6909030.1 PspC domain-containing protein [Lachnospiraceae bacterium]